MKLKELNDDQRLQLKWELLRIWLEAESFIMCSALDNEEFAGVSIGGVVRSRELVHKPMLVVYSAAPACQCRRSRCALCL